MLIKLFQHKLVWTIVLSSLLVALSYASFGSPLYCHVRGYVYYDGYDSSSLDRNDLCTSISDYTEGDVIILFNDIQWVVIKIPKTVKGHTSFWYKWGSDNAYMNGSPVHIEWGYTLRG